MSTTHTVCVTDLRDPYFGKNISNNAKDIAEVFAYYTKKKREDNTHWTTFTYRRWSGYEEKVKICISRIFIDEHLNCCYIEMKSTSDILDHYWPAPSNLIDDKYISSTWQFKDTLDNLKIVLDQYWK